MVDLDPRKESQQRLGSGASSSVRLFFVDNLRVTLTVLVVLHHSALSFAGGGGLSVGVLTMFTLVNQAYFMGLFFLLSGYFVPGSLGRKGVGVFLRDRFVRLLLTLVGYVVLLSPITALDVNSGADLDGPLWRLYLDNLSVGALWFLEILLILTVAYALVNLVLGRLRNGSAGEGHQPRQLPSVLQVAGLIIGLAALTYAVRTVLPFGAGLLNIPTPSHLPQYTLMFLVGVVAYRRDWFRRLPPRAGTIGFVLAGVSTVTLAPVAFLNTPAFMGGWHWSAFVYALWESTLCVGLALGLLSLFRRRLNQQGRLGRYLSQHAFTVFLLHLPVIALLTLATEHLPDKPFLHFVVGAPLAVAISFALAYPIRSLTPLRRIL